jgi:ABC-type polar amino acid transport system ATPase subunit
MKKSNFSHNRNNSQKKKVFNKDELFHELSTILQHEHVMLVLIGIPGSGKSTFARALTSAVTQDSLLLTTSKTISSTTAATSTSSDMKAGVDSKKNNKSHLFKSTYPMHSNYSALYAT